jgi:TetR/AcrR family transcriptional regulator, mexJK operon transcriptional repressor
MARKTTPKRGAQPGTRHRSSKKRRAILDAAAGIFLESGYLGTSVDAIAAAASVSKQTLYQHFGDKETLFVRMVLETIDEVSAPFLEKLDALEAVEPVEEAIRGLARDLIRIVLQPRVLRLRRLVIAEAPRFPELGRAYFERAPGRTIEALADLFARLAARGRLRVEDPRAAAAHFNWLVLSIPMNEILLLGDYERFTLAQLDAFADSGARTFLAAFGARPEHG